MSSSSPVAVLKLRRGADTRRLRVAWRQETFVALEAKVRAAFGNGGVEPFNFKASYVDDEGDRVRVTSDLELAEAFQSVVSDGDAGGGPRKSLRLDIETVPAAPAAAAAAAAATAAQKTPEKKPVAAVVKAMPVVVAARRVAAAAPRRAATAATAATAAASSFANRHGPSATTIASVTGVGGESKTSSADSKVKERVEWRKKAAAEAKSKTAKTINKTAAATTAAKTKTRTDTTDTTNSSHPNSMSFTKVQQTCAAKKTSPDDANGSAADANNNKPSKPVPLETLTGVAKIFLDGTVEQGLLSGDAIFSASPASFPSVGAQGVALVSGKWYYECTLLTDGCMQVGWATPGFVGHAERGEGVGDCAASWAYDGFRRKKWHAGRNHRFGPKWAVGQTVCCALDADQGVLRFALDGQWGGAGDDVAFHNVARAALDQGLFPAASFSKFEKCRFNFGAPGTPLKFAPPDGTYANVWESYGNSASNLRNGRTQARPTFTNTAKMGSGSPKSKLQSSSSPPQKQPAPPQKQPAPPRKQPAPPALSPAQQQLAALVLEPEVRTALSQALSEPAIAEALQSVLSAALTTGKVGARQCLLEKLPSLIPIATHLVAARPELIAVGANLFAILREEGVVGRRGNRGGPCGPWGPMMMGLFGMGGGGGGGNSCHRAIVSTPATAESGCPRGDGVPGRASRDADWRAHLGEGMKTLSAKLAEAAAATTAAAATVVDAAAESVGIGSPVTSHGRKKVECAQVAAAIEASKKDKEELDLQKAVNASLEAMAAAEAEAGATAAAAAGGGGAVSLAVTEEHLPPAAREATHNNTNNKTKNNKNNNTMQPGASAFSGGESKTAEPEAAKPRARFVKDVAPRKTALAPGQPFTHSWRLCNNGRHPWGAVVAKCTGGDPLLGGDAVVAVESGLAPGQVVDVEVSLVAPNHEGRFISYWRLHDEASGTKFGDRIWVDVSVHAQEDSSLGDAADASLTSSLEKEEEQEQEQEGEETPFAGAIAAAPLLKDLNQAPYVVEAADGETPSEASSTVVSEEPDWVEVGNSLLAMSQTGSAAEPPEAADPSEEGVVEALAAAAPPAPEVSPSPAPAPAPSTEDVDVLAPLLEQLAAMGFSDTATATAALAASDGDVAAAVAMLIAHQ